MPNIKNSSADNREYIFKLWYQHGRNDSETVRVCKQEGFSVTRQTLSTWRDKYDWVNRADKLDALKVEATDSSLSRAEQMLKDFERQKKRFESYFTTLGDKVDTQSMYAYTQLCQMILKLSKEVTPKSKQQKGLTSDSSDRIRKEILGLK